jgi:hypothetical protein
MISIIGRISMPAISISIVNLANGHYREHFIQSGDTRVVNLSFSYRFGRSGKEPAGRHPGGADEELNRVKP